VRQRFVEQGEALNRQVQQNANPGDSTVKEAHLLVMLCPTPEGQGRWTLRLLAEGVELGERASHETVRQTLKKTNSSRG